MTWCCPPLQLELSKYLYYCYFAAAAVATAPTAATTATADNAATVLSLLSCVVVNDDGDHLGGSFYDCHDPDSMMNS